MFYGTLNNMPTIFFRYFYWDSKNMANFGVFLFVSSDRSYSPLGRRLRAHGPGEESLPPNKGPAFRMV